MNLHRSEEETLIRKLLLSHDPDGRALDSQLLLRAVENVMFHATKSEFPVTDPQSDANAITHIRDIELIGSPEPLGHTIIRISHEIQCKWSGVRDLQKRTLGLFEILGNFRWDTKMVLVLAALATSYGGFWLIMQLYPHNALAVSIATLKQLPTDISSLKPRFRSLRLLVKSMVDVTKCIIKFEGLPLEHIQIDDEAISTAKSHIYLAAYWVTRSALTCSSHIAELIAMKPEQVNPNSTLFAVWELTSLVHKLSSIYNRLKQLMDICYEQIETKMHQKLLRILSEAHVDNQEGLHLLFALKDDLPLKVCSTQAKVSVSELKNKVIILLVSKPELFSLEKLLLLVHQTYDHPQKKNLEESYEIVWVPISSSGTWTDSEERSFHFLSNSLPWHSVRKPWLLNLTVVSYMKQAWKYSDEPIMVVLDPQGMVTNFNAIDMMFIWGAKGHPFSSSREKELWEEEKWTLKLMFDEIDPLITTWVKEGKSICIFGSDNLDWIRELNSKLKEIIASGVQLEMVYVGKNNPNAHVRNIIAILNEEMNIKLLSITKICFFWVRLESMRRSISRLSKIANADHISEEVTTLLDIDSNEKNWAVIGRGFSTEIVKLEGKEVMGCLYQFPGWEKNVEKLGFLGALRNALEPALVEGPCGHSSVVPYAEGLIKGTAVCEKCKCLMKKFIVYE